MVQILGIIGIAIGSYLILGMIFAIVMATFSESFDWLLALLMVFAMIFWPLMLWDLVLHKNSTKLTKKHKTDMSESEFLDFLDRNLLQFERERMLDESEQKTFTQDE